MVSYFSIYIFEILVLNSKYTNLEIEKMIKLNIKEMPQWRKNLYVLAFGDFVSGTGFSMSLPFLPLFISQMAHFTNVQLTFYSGLAYAIAFVSQAIVSPLWGKLADRTGRKPMILRSAFGMCITGFLCGLAHNIWILIFWRFVYGCFSGYNSNSQALVASEVPSNQGGKAMGILTTGRVGGQLIGPIIGGMIAGVWGYRMTFYLFGIIMFIAGILALVFVKEEFTPHEVAKNASRKEKSALAQVNSLPIVIAMFITAMLVNAVTKSINPVISLFVRQLLHGHGSVSVVSGIITALPGFATIMAAHRLGDLGDRIGARKVLVAGLIFSGCVFFATSWVGNVYTLGIYRFLIGISDAALLPLAQTVLMNNAPDAVVSRVFSYMQSFQAIGSIIGPMLGSVIAGHFSYPDVFVMTAILAAINLLIVLISFKMGNNKKNA